MDSYVGMKLFSILRLAVVFTFFVQNKSFTAMGTPGSFLLKSGFESNSVAFFKAVSKVSSLYVFKFFWEEKYEWNMAQRA